MVVATLEHPCEVDRFQESYCDHIEHHCEVGKLQEFVPAQQPAGSTFFIPGTWLQTTPPLLTAGVRSPSSRLRLCSSLRWPVKPFQSVSQEM